MDIKLSIIPEFEAGVIVINENKVLVVERNEMNDITIPKGHVENGESLQLCALRETVEETGYDVNLTNYIDSFEYLVQTVNRIYLRRVYCFAAEIIGDPQEIQDKKEVSNILWLTYAEVLHKIPYDNVKQVIQIAFQMHS